MMIAQSAWLDNPSTAPAGTPQHIQYWQQQLVAESLLARHKRPIRNPEFEANAAAYWRQIFNTEGNNGSSTETT